MRKLIPTVLCLSVALAVASPATAQVQIGLKGGLNLGKTIETSTDPEFPDLPLAFSNRRDFGGGLFVLVQAEARVGAMIEGLYNRRGGRITVLDEVPVRHVLWTLQNIDVNGMVTIRVLNTLRAIVRVFGGASIGFKLKAEIFDGTETLDYSDDIKTREISIVAGAFATFGRLVIDARYLRGLDTVVINPTANRFVNRTISVMAGVMF